jgi:hypothetical protein
LPGLRWRSRRAGEHIRRLRAENMRGVTSDTAAKSIKTACLRKSSVELSADDVKGLKGHFASSRS